MVDARLPDGSRVNAVIHPLAIGGPFLTIRKFAKDPFQVDDLIRFGTFNAAAARFLEACVVGRLNIIVAAAPAPARPPPSTCCPRSSPTRSASSPSRTPRSSSSTRTTCSPWRPGPPNIEGRRDHHPRPGPQLAAYAPRPHRGGRGPRRRGPGHAPGHEHRPRRLDDHRPRQHARDALSRIETMALMAGMDLPVRAIREQMASALDLIVHLTRLRDGTRRVTHVTEVQGMEGDVITLQDVFLFDYGMGIDQSGRFKGHLKATGIRPRFAEKLQDLGVKLGAELFATEGFGKPAGAEGRAGLRRHVRRHPPGRRGGGRDRRPGVRRFARHPQGRHHQVPHDRHLGAPRREAGEPGRRPPAGERPVHQRLPGRAPRQDGRSGGRRPADRHVGVDDPERQDHGGQGRGRSVRAVEGAQRPDRPDELRQPAPAPGELHCGHQPPPQGHQRPRRHRRDRPVGRRAHRRVGCSPTGPSSSPTWWCSATVRTRYRRPSSIRRSLPPSVPTRPSSPSACRGATSTAPRSRTWPRLDGGQYFAPRTPRAP